MSAEPSSAVNRRVLVVEDLPDVRESLQELLELSLQVEVDTAEDGVVALQMLLARDYVLVITDLRMPKTSGMGLLREIRDRGLSSAVVVVTGHGGVREAVEAMRLGAYDFLTKPVDPRQLVMLVDRIVRERAGPPPDPEAVSDVSGESVSLTDPGTAPTTRAEGHGAS